ncbi:CarD family transcriptional regulator [bacterium]|nr:CarD family transcriptional regulator [bacterium]
MNPLISRSLFHLGGDKMKKINEHVIYRREMCVIEDIQKIGSKDYYTLSIFNDPSLKVKIPADNETLIDPVMTKKEALELIDEIQHIGVLDVGERNLDLEYKKLFNTKDRKDLIKIIKTTYLRNTARKENGKKAQEKDSIYFERAEKYFYSELAYVLDMPIKEVKKFVYDKVQEKENN